MARTGGAARAGIARGGVRCTVPRMTQPAADTLIRTLHDFAVANAEGTRTFRLADIDELVYRDPIAAFDPVVRFAAELLAALRRLKVGDLRSVQDLRADFDVNGPWEDDGAIRDEHTIGAFVHVLAAADNDSIKIEYFDFHQPQDARVALWVLGRLIVDIVNILDDEIEDRRLRTEVLTTATDRAVGIG